MAAVACEIMASGEDTDFKLRLNNLKLERKFLQQDAISMLDRYCQRVSDGREQPMYEVVPRAWGAVSSHRCPLSMSVDRSDTIGFAGARCDFLWAVASIHEFTVRIRPSVRQPR